MLIPKLAWRNIWRNRRRTYITAASIMFAVLLGSLMESLQKGAWDNMISNVVNYYYSFAQIHQKGYWEDQKIDKAFLVPDNLLSSLERISNLNGGVPRLESFALAASENLTTGVLLVGTDVDSEDKLTNLSSRVSKGRYLRGDEDAVLVASGLAEKLKLAVGDTLVLISQGFHGINAAGKYPIAGLLEFGSPELNNQMTYMPLSSAQWFYGAEGRATSIALMIDDGSKTGRVVRELNKLIGEDDFEVNRWEEMLPDLVKAKALDSAGNYIVYFILYLVIAFGIFGTILMMTKEREYEFGVLVSIGMKRMMLTTVVFFEIVLLAVLGSVAGILLSLPLVGYFHINPIRFSGTYADVLDKFGFEPIFPALFDPKIFLLQAAIVFVIAIILSSYPFWKIRKLRPVEAMRP